MRLNELDQRILRILGKWFDEGKREFGRNPETLRELNLDNNQYDKVMNVMENIGAIEALHAFSHEPNYIAQDVTILPDVAQLIKELDCKIRENKKAKRYKWLTRGEKLIWIIIGSIITIVTSIVILWLSGKLGFER